MISGTPYFMKQRHLKLYIFIMKSYNTVNRFKSKTSTGYDDIPVDIMKISILHTADLAGHFGEIRRYDTIR